MKTPTPRLRCFVAMAIGQPETDKWFERVLPGAVRGLPIKLQRVDRVEHNDNIDQKILQLIEESDLVIADLTFARPSVYFEAGYAQRVVPVIYTCRADHFKARHDDVHQNFQVHFDLKMRNIVPWKSLKDVAFNERLNKRVRHVIRPLLADRDEGRRIKLEQEQFAGLSSVAKQQALRGAAISLLRKDVRYMDGRPYDKEPLLIWYKDQDEVSLLLLWGVMNATPTEMLQNANLHLGLIVRQRLGDLLEGLGAVRMRWWVIFYSAAGISDSRIRAARVNSSPLAGGGLAYSGEWLLNGKKRLPFVEEIHTLSRVRSQRDFVVRLMNALGSSRFLSKRATTAFFRP